jgi:hypothetical protein
LVTGRSCIAVSLGIIAEMGFDRPGGAAILEAERETPAADDWSRTRHTGVPRAYSREIMRTVSVPA